MRSRRKLKAGRCELTIVFFDCWPFKKEVHTLGRVLVWWFLRLLLKEKPWHVIAIIDGLIYETCAWQGCIRYPLTALTRYPFRVYSVEQDDDVADLLPWALTERVTPVRLSMAVIGFTGCPGTITCATTICSLLGIEPPFEMPWELMEYLEAKSQGTKP